MITVTSLFILAFMVKMSHTPWSQLPDEQGQSNVTLMDREVAGGWLDEWRPDHSFTFRAFTRNVPHYNSMTRARRPSDVMWSEESGDDEGLGDISPTDIGYSLQVRGE